jgi:hypothetical protein
VLNICERIGVHVPVDLSILVTWRIVAVAVVGEARACQNCEIGGLPFHLALSILRNFPLYNSCVYNSKMNLWLIGSIEQLQQFSILMF